MTFVPNPVAIAEILESPAGLVGRRVIDLATIVQLRAQENAPKKTGRLTAGIVKRFAPATPGSIEVQVGVWTVDYAYSVHEGNDVDGTGWITPKHTRADGGVPMLRFVGANGVVFARRVRATKPRRFLTEALGSIAAEL